MLRGVVYMLIRIEQRTEPRGPPHDRGWGDIKPDARTEKERDDK